MLLNTLQIVSVLVSTACFAQKVEHILNNEVINALIANDNNCVVGCSADKVYLNSSRICPTDQGLFLNINNEDYVLLPELNSNREGCYVAVRNLDVEECGNRILQSEKWKCPYCNHWWSMGDKCDYENCPTNQWKEKQQENKNEEK